MSKEKRVSTEVAQQDYITNKLLCALTIAFVMIMGVLFFSRMMRNVVTINSGHTAVICLSIALLAGAVVSAVIAFIKKGKSKEYKLVTPKHIAVVLGFAGVCFGYLAMAFNPSTLTLLYVLIPTVTVLFIVYHVYPCDFFAISCMSAFGAVAVWLLGSACNGEIGVSKIPLIIVLSALAIVIMLAATIVLNVISSTMKKEILPKEFKFYLLYITLALIAACLVATWIMVGAITYYLLFVILAYFVVVGIYYTLKML